MHCLNVATSTLKATNRTHTQWTDYFRWPRQNDCHCCFTFTTWSLEGGNSTAINVPFGLLILCSNFPTVIDVVFSCQPLTADFGCLYVTLCFFLKLSNGDCYVPLTKTCKKMDKKCKVDVENVICLARLGNFGFRAQCVQMMWFFQSCPWPKQKNKKTTPTCTEKTKKMKNCKNYKQKISATRATQSRPNRDQIPTKSRPNPDPIPTQSRPTRPNPDPIPTKSRPNPDPLKPTLAKLLLNLRFWHSAKSFSAKTVFFGEFQSLFQICHEIWPQHAFNAVFWRSVPFLCQKPAEPSQPTPQHFTSSICPCSLGLPNLSVFDFYVELTMPNRRWAVGFHPNCLFRKRVFFCNVPQT